MPMELVRLKYSHEAMIDQMIVNPTVSVRELSLRFGVTENWIYRVRSSSMFRDKLRARTKELVDPAIAAELDERFDAAVNRSLEVLMDKISRDSEEVDPNLALEVAKLGAKARGIGGFGAKAVPMAAPPDPDRLERLAERLLNLNRQGAIDVQCHEVPVSRQAGSV